MFVVCVFVWIILICTVNAGLGKIHFYIGVLEHNGLIYIRKLRNIVITGNCKQRVHFIFYNIIDRVKIEPLRSKQLMTGKRVAFTCNALEGEQVRFSWTKNGKIIHPGGRIGIVSVDETSTFTIKSVSAADSGEYTCIASNDVSEDRSSAKLMVEGTDQHYITTFSKGSFIFNLVDSFFLNRSQLPSQNYSYTFLFTSNINKFFIKI